MQIRHKINGKDVTQEEWDTHNAPGRLDEMFAAGQPPMSNTDREFLEGHANGSQFADTPHIGDYYKQMAASAGLDVKGKVYISGLAAFPGDPKAWVTGRGDAAKVVEERGWGAEGSVNVKMQNVAEPTGGGVAPDIVEAAVETAMENPEVACQPVEAVREQVVEKLKPHWTK